MPEQSFQNHTKFESKFITIALLLIISIVSIVVGFYIESLKTIPGRWIEHHTYIFGIISATCIWIILGLLLLITRSYATKLQDRIIRQEVAFRYFVMTQTMIDPRITLKQMIALRFAGDEEFVSLCQQAIEQQLEPTTIKSMIKHWKPDHVRV